MIYRNILFICSGNTCRSQMAEALVKAQWPQQPVMSAGVRARAGQPTSTHALTVLAENNIQWYGTSRLFDELFVKQTITSEDLLLVMTAEHQQIVQGILSATGLSSANLSAKKLPKLALLAVDKDIADPYGQYLNTYRQCFLQIQQALLQHLTL